ncbi:MAG: amidohydrolase family protein [Clostridia bacterium]|nr:amidohydrolase family protein [Clostridia bacterium]
MENKYAGKIIDTHAHIYPDKIAERAVHAIGDFYDIKMAKGGNIAGLLESGSKIGVKKYVVHSLATTVHQVQSINNFILTSAKENEAFVPFATLHPGMLESDMFDEVDRVISLGAKGLKLHPDFQKFNIDDENVFKIYRACKGRLPILFHAGDNRYDFSAPTRLARVAKLFPDLKVIAAHFGGYHRWEEVGVYKGLDNVYYDTCSALFMLTPREAEDIIDMLGVDRFFFSTDYPMWDHEDEFNNVMKLSLSEEEREMVFYKNAERVLGI